MESKPQRFRANKPTKKKFDEVVKKCFGNVTEIAKALKCQRPTVYRWKDNFDSADVFAEANDMRLDMLEKEAFERATKGKSDSLLIFMLKTQGQKRGYIEKQQFDHNIAPPTAVNVISVVANELDE